MKLRTRITLSMLFIVVTSMFVIGVVTIWFFARQNSEYHQERLERKERAIKAEMTYFSKIVEAQENADVVVREFEQELLRLASVHRLEINFFNTSGEILLAARPDSIHSEYMNKRVPQSTLSDLQTVDRIVIPETEGTRQYLSDYTNLYNIHGDRIAILNIPYLQDSSINDKELEAFLGSIGLAYAVILALGILLSFLLSRSITRNLSALGDRMEQLDLTRETEPFNWESDDEIGTLVRAYNTMLLKLEESRDELAKQERESAWREMAKQVAHEIKNPLTPIKLSVQHLQATAAHDDPQWREKFKRTMQTIISQIETLSNIASEFSDFAKMPAASARKVDLTHIVAEAAVLFTDLPFHFETDLPDEPIYTHADPEQLGRVLNNLLKNAKHAVSERADGCVLLSLKRHNDRAVIAVEDNGVGIPDDIKANIFRPNFTTKSSGTGLGLAISRQIVESAGGEIDFESREGKGTIFRVRLPLSEA